MLEVKKEEDSCSWSRKMTVSRGVKNGFVALLLVFVAFSSAVVVVDAAASSSVLVDRTGGFKLGSTTAPSSVASTTKDVVTIIYSPGVPSLFVDSDEDSSSSLLSLREDDGVVLCQGATLNSNDLSAGERTALATASLVSNSIIIDGITTGDVEAGVSHQTRHSRTVNILFRSKLAAISAAEDGQANSSTRQTLIFAIKPSSEDDDVGTGIESTIMEGLQTTFDALAVESGLKSVSIDDLYDIKIVSVSSSGEAKEVCICAVCVCRDELGYQSRFAVRVAGTDKLQVIDFLIADQHQNKTGRFFLICEIFLS